MQNKHTQNENVAVACTCMPINQGDGIGKQLLLYITCNATVRPNTAAEDVRTALPSFHPSRFFGRDTGRSLRVFGIEKRVCHRLTPGGYCRISWHFSSMHTQRKRELSTPQWPLHPVVHTGRRHEQPQNESSHWRKRCHVVQEEK